MRLTIIGSGTGIPSPRRGPAGYLVQAASTAMLFDCGPGTMERLVSRGGDWKTIDRIFLSHHHPDHCADVIAFLFANNWEAPRRAKHPLHITGPLGTRQFMEKLSEAFPGLSWQSAGTIVEEWERGAVEDTAWQVSSGPVDHAGLHALAYRISAEGRTLVYSGDTGETENIVDIAQNADTLLAECSYPDSFVGQKSHLTAGAAGRVAARAGVGRLVLTHFYPECEEVDIRAQCAAEFSGEIILAHDGLVIEI